MSVTFYPANDWQMKEIPCTVCRVCEKELDPFCTGFRSEPDCPHINMANGNAMAILDLIGLPVDECCGEVDAKDLPRTMRAIIKAQNVEARRQGITELPYESGGPGTGHCRVVYGGRSEGYVMARLQDLMGLAKHCQDNDCGFYWA